MSTSAQIVADAMSRLRLLDDNEDPSAAEAEKGLRALNAMIAGWAADGISISSDIPLPAEHEEGVVALLAVRLADDFGANITPVVARDAAAGMARLQSAYQSAPLTQFDRALRTTPSKPIVYIIALNNWAVSTAYAEFDRVANGRHGFECIVAGTSASTGSGPQPYGPFLTDGSVTWRYIGETN